MFQDEIEWKIISAIPRAVLTTLASLLADTRPLGWYPGWKFAAGESELNWIGRQRFALWRLFESKRLPGPVRIRWYDGIRLVVYLGNDLSRCLYVGGVYEPNEFMFLSEVLRPGMTFIDVGANDGLYSLFAARRVAPTGRVLAFEPSLREFSRLEKNISLNKLTTLLPLRMAVSDREGVATLRVAGFGHEGQNTLGEFAYNIEMAGTEQVPMITLDQMIDRYDLQTMDVLKIDAEGAELAVLKGAKSAIAKFRPLILLELVEAALVHQSASQQAIINLLESAGYRFAVFGDAGRPEMVNRVDLDGVNIIAVHQDSKISVYKE